jgi:sigma-E factor negative regulatory protein RseC
MTQNAIVTKIVDSRTAEVTVTRATACGGNCSSCGGSCATRNKLTALAINSASASVGDSVIVSSYTSKIIGAAVLVYIVPLITFFAGYVLSVLLSFSGKLSILISLVFFFAGVAGVVLSQRAKKKNAISLEIISIQE